MLRSDPVGEKVRGGLESGGRGDACRRSMKLRSVGDNRSQLGGRASLKSLMELVLVQSFIIKIVFLVSL